MTDDELRALVREAIARQMMGGALAGRGGGLPQPAPAPSPDLAASWGTAPSLPSPALSPQVPAPSAGATVVIANAPGGVAIAAGPGATVQVHISHATFSLLPACEGGHDGPCAVEPDAACNQCGFCQSFGH